MTPSRFDLHRLAEAVRAEHVQWQYHAQLRLIERQFDADAVLAALLEADMIEDYTGMRPQPTALFLGTVNNRLVHVVAGLDESTGWAYIITLYEPALDKFEAGGRTRRKP